MKTFTKFTISLFILLFLIISSTAYAESLWPVQVGMWWEMDKYDSAAPQNNWTVRIEVVGQESFNGKGYFRLAIWNDQPGDYDEVLFRSTEDAVYSIVESEEEVVWYQAPVGTVWCDPRYDPTKGSAQRCVEVVSIESVTVPHGTYDNVYVMRKHKEWDDPSIPDSPYWYEYFASDIGWMVKEVDYFTKNAPTYSGLARSGMIQDEVISDFGSSYGIWARYDDGAWQQLHGLSPEIMIVGDIDCNGLDDLIVDFGAPYGIWVKYDGGSWQQLHGLSPEMMIAGDINGNGCDDLIVDFGSGTGLWLRYDDGSWEQLHGLSPEIMVVGDIDCNGLDDLIVDFGTANGIWVRYDDGSWEQLHGLSPDIMVVGDIDGDGCDDLIVDFGDVYGIWVRYDDGSWEQLHGLSPEIMVVGDIDCNGLDDLIADFGAAYGIWVKYDDGSWEQLHGLSPEIMVVGDIDGDGCDDLIVDFGDVYGIWVRYDDGSWEQLHGLSPEIMIVGDIYDSGAHKFKLPDTGQTQSYTDTFGEDSDYTINPLSYTYNGNRTVTDNITGLMWQQEDDGQQYTWYEAYGTYDANYNPDSKDVCGSLSLAGYSDWRLPSRKELITIVNYGNYFPAIDTTYFPNTKVSGYWTSTTDAAGTSYAWRVWFNSGSVYNPNKQFSWYVRCVRGAHVSRPIFMDNGNGTVTDIVTGLMWQQDDDGAERTWEQAITYCEGLSLGGYSDWRLPNVKELESIMDDSVWAPRIDTTYFPNAKARSFWSSTTSVSSPGGWVVGFGDGGVGTHAKETGNADLVRCVRSGQ